MIFNYFKNNLIIIVKAYWLVRNITIDMSLVE